MEEPGSLNRPSFSEFWKKSKSTLGAGKIRFVESKPSPSQQQPSAAGAGASVGAGAGADAGPADRDGHDAPASDKPLDKAQLRRAQVRRAQTQHRQRKANYIRELETDVARIRDMIEAAERETQALLDENKALRTRVQNAAAATTTATTKLPPPSLDQRVSLLRDLPAPAPLATDTGLALQDHLDTVTVSLGFDEAINAATFYVTPPLSSSSPSTAARPSPPRGDPAPDDLPDLTPAQTQAAINFILALEHMCRWHFHPAAYDPSYRGHKLVPRTNGHALMATSLALRHAPLHIFGAALRSTAAVRRVPGVGIPLRPVPRVSLVGDGGGGGGGGGDGDGLPLSPPHAATGAECGHDHGQGAEHAGCGAGGSTLPPGVDDMDVDMDVGGAGTAAGTAAATAADNNNNNNTTDADADADTDDKFSWQTSALTLRSLHGLATSLNTDDDTELTPVQAWFELVRRFGAGRLMAAGVLDALKRELNALVKCRYYGASMLRGPFEGVVEGVLSAAAPG